MTSILLACPTCKKRVSSSARSCPNCGEVLTAVWAEKGLRNYKRQSIVWAIFLTPVIFLVAAAIVAIATGPDQQEKVETPVRAFFLRTGLGSAPALFMDIQARPLDLKGLRVTVLCPTDGTGEVVAEVNGEFVAVNMAARGWAESKEFWIVLKDRFVPIIDSGYPDNVPKRLEVLGPYVDTIIKAGVGMCPLASPAFDTASAALRDAVEGFTRNAKRLGISDR